MLDLLKRLAGSRAGLASLAGLAALLVGGGVVPHDSAEGQALGLGAVAVVALGGAIGGPKLLAWWQARQQGGGPPPAGPSA